MNELEKGLQNSISLDESQEILKLIISYTDKWGVTLPANTQPLVFDFGSRNFFSIGETEFWIVNEVEHGYCAKYMFLFENQRCPVHRHFYKHETFYIVKGAISLTIEDNSYTLDEGEKKSLDPGLFHGFIAKKPTLILEVSMPSIIRDNEFRDSKLGYSNS